MTISQNGIDLIKGFEGLILHVYLDIAHVPTVGYGSTYYEDGTKVKMTDPPITQERAENLLRLVVNQTAKEVDALIVGTINQNQFDALTSFTYNTGVGALKSSTLRRLVNANPSDPAIRDAFMMWTKVRQDGKLVPSSALKTRRKKEADLYFS